MRLLNTTLSQWWTKAFGNLDDIQTKHSLNGETSRQRQTWQPIEDRLWVLSACWQDRLHVLTETTIRLTYENGSYIVQHHMVYSTLHFG